MKFKKVIALVLAIGAVAAVTAMPASAERNPIVSYGNVRSFANSAQDDYFFYFARNF